MLRKYNGGGYSDKEGNVYLCTKSFLGIGKKSIRIDEMDFPEPVSIIKVVCEECKKEYVVFDSRKHGYDALCDEEIYHEEEYEFQQIKPGSKCGVKIRIINDLTPEDLGEEYNNAFSDITIYAVIDGKKKEVFSMETA